MLLSPLAMKSLITIEKVLLRMTIANFHGNSSPAVISCGSPTIASKAKRMIFTENYQYLLEPLLSTVY